jgi:hypothetical protein
MENANQIKFRCSALGYLMTEARSKSETISEGTKTHLIDVFVGAKYLRKEEISSKYLTKGNERESDSTTLLSRVNKVFYKQNKEPELHLSNEFIKGTPDIYLGNSIEDADEIIDTKTSWSAHTFFRAKKNALDKMYYWQGVGYMLLTGAKKHTVAYCLVNGTDKAIMEEKRKLAYQMNEFGVDVHSDEYISKCKQIEINHIFDLENFRKDYPFFEFDNNVAEWSYDIPFKERVFQFSFERNEADMLRLVERIKECRIWMNENLFV